jgi:hypothetical protein
MRDLFHALRHARARLVQQRDDLLEVSRPLRDDDAELRQVAAQRIDQLRALSHKALARAESHRPRLALGAFDRHAMHVRTQGRLCDRRGVGRIVLLASDE